jgi:hypothetical protein
MREIEAHKFRVKNMVGIKVATYRERLYEYKYSLFPLSRNTDFTKYRKTFKKMPQE